MIRRTMSPGNLNRVCNHPAVRPWLGGEGDLDVSDVLSNAANIALEIDGGGFILINRGSGTYEVHSQFVPEVRRYTVRVMRESMEYVFTRTDCLQLTTQLPDDNPAALAIGEKAGFRAWFRREQTALGPSTFGILTIDEWISGNQSLEEHGERFHGALEAAKAQTGSHLPTHDHDPIHERYVGAAVLMAERGNITKGVGLYNRWAVTAGYAPISIISQVPPVVDAIDAIVSLDTDGLTVLHCR